MGKKIDKLNKIQKETSAFRSKINQKTDFSFNIHNNQSSSQNFELQKIKSKNKFLQISQQEAINNRSQQFKKQFNDLSLDDRIQYLHYNQILFFLLTKSQKLLAQIRQKQSYSEKYSQCLYCGKKFKKGVSLGGHIAKKHSKKKLKKHSQIKKEPEWVNFANK